MSVLFVALPVALLVAAVFVSAFVWQVRSGQLDDLETPPRRVLFDDITKSQCDPGSRLVSSKLTIETHKSDQTTN